MFQCEEWIKYIQPGGHALPEIPFMSTASGRRLRNDLQNRKYFWADAELPASGKAKAPEPQTNQMIYEI